MMKRGMIKGPQYFAASWDSGFCLPTNWVTFDFGRGRGEEILLFNKKNLRPKLNKFNGLELYLVNPLRTEEIPLTRTLQNDLIMQARIWTPQTLLNHLLDIAFQCTPFRNAPRISGGPISYSTSSYTAYYSEASFDVYFNRYIYMHVEVLFSTHKADVDFDHVRYEYYFCADVPNLANRVISHNDLSHVETNSYEVQDFIDHMLISIQKILTDPWLYIPEYPEIEKEPEESVT